MKKIEAPIIGNNDKKTYNLDPIVFSTNINPLALAQVIRVYQSNSHQQTKKVKTRGEVAGSTRKIYRQKGTGGARHGSKKAPIFVGGGIVFGPTLPQAKPLRLTQKLRAKALAGTLTAKLENKHLFVFDSPKMEKPSTKAIISIFRQNSLQNQRILLIYTDSDPDNLLISTRNLEKISQISASELNALQVFSSQKVILTPSAAQALSERINPFLKTK